MATKIPYEYSIIRKEDNYRIISRNVLINDSGIWINDDLETQRDDCAIFIPFHNILQINRYEIKYELKELN